MTARRTILSGVCLLGLVVFFTPAMVEAGGAAGDLAAPRFHALLDPVRAQGLAQLPEAATECASSSDCLNCAMTVPDHTLVERWELGEPNPGGDIPYGWFDVVGLEVFNTFQVQASWCGGDLVIKILTNFPEAGEGDGTIIGYPSGGYWQPADLFFDFDFDGTWDVGIALADHGAIPADPSSPNPPGYGQPADNFVKGGIYQISAWFSSDDIHYYHTGRGGRYDLSAPKVPPVWMRLGTKIGDAQVTWAGFQGTDPAYQIEVVLSGLNPAGEWDHFNLLWGTANCANDVIVASTEVEPEIVANFVDGPLTLGLDTPAAITASLYPGRYQGINASWWLLVQTPYDPPAKWYSFVAETGWLGGLAPFRTGPLEVLEPLEVLNSTLSPGAFNFHLGVLVKSHCVPRKVFRDWVTVNVSDTETPVE